MLPDPNDDFDIVEVSPFDRARRNFGRSDVPFEGWDDPEILSAQDDVFWSLAPERPIRAARAFCRDCYEDLAEIGEIVCFMCKADAERHNPPKPPTAKRKKRRAS